MDVDNSLYKLKDYEDNTQKLQMKLERISTPLCAKSILFLKEYQQFEIEVIYIYNNCCKQYLFL